MIDYDKFFSIIDIDESEKESAKEYIALRGLQEHIDMATYLLSFLATRKPTYKEVATAFRYDKRIRRILYKYIGLLEEMYRAYICNNFNNIKQLGLKTSKPLFQYISLSLFSSLVNIVWSLDENHKKELFEGKAVLKKNLDALVTLRNAIGHNRTIINYRDYKEATLSTGEVGNSLLINIKNMLDFLPSEIRNKCIKEINEANRSGTTKIKNQVGWKLVPSLVIELVAQGCNNNG